MKFRIINFILIISILSNIQASESSQATCPTGSAESVKEKTELYQILLKKIVKQLDTISVTSQEINEAINNKSISVTDKGSVNKYLANILTFIKRIKENEIRFDPSERGLASLLLINKSLIENLEDYLNNNFSGTNLDSSALLKRSERVTCSDYAYLQLMANENEHALNRLITRNRQIGTSYFNRLVRGIENYSHGFGITKLLKRSSPYLIMAGYYSYLTPKSQLPNWGWLHKVKDLVSYIPGAAQDPNIEDVRAKVATSSDSAAKVLKATTDEAAKYMKDADDSKRKVNAIVTGAANAYAEVSSSNGSSSKSKNPVAYGFLQFETNPINIGFSAIFLTIMKRDAEDLYNWTSEKAKQFLTVAKGESYEAPALIKPSKLLFSDIIGFDHVKNQLQDNFVRYFKSKEAHDRAGTFIERGIMFAGPRDIGRLFVSSLCGEINNELKLQGFRPECGIHEIHSSKLVSKSIDDIIKSLDEEASLNAPTILFIDNIDWLYEKSPRNAKIWADLINAMNRNLRGYKKQFFIVATVSNSKTLDENLKGQGRFNTVIQFENPTFTDRKSYVIKELKNRGSKIDDFDIDRIALLTQNCSYSNLASLIKNSFAIARSSERLVTQSDFEQSIDSVIYRIIPNAINRSLEQRQILANNFAGQAIAHVIKNPRHQNLVKVTILPVGDEKAGIAQGALITRSVDHANEFITSNNLKDECVILLAGIETQKLLNANNQVAYNIALEIKAKAFAKAKQIVLDGDDERSLTKELKQKKLAQARELLEQCASEAANIISNNELALKNIVKELISNNTLTLQEIERIRTQA